MHCFSLAISMSRAGSRFPHPAMAAQYKMTCLLQTIVERIESNKTSKLPTTLKYPPHCIAIRIDLRISAALSLSLNSEAIRAVPFT